MADIQCRSNEHTLKFAGEDLIKLEGLEVKKQQGKNKRMTTTSVWQNATYTRAVFSMAFSYKGNETPDKKNNWLLEANGWYVGLCGQKELTSS